MQDSGRQRPLLGCGTGGKSGIDVRRQLQIGADKQLFYGITNNVRLYFSHRLFPCPFPFSETKKGSIAHRKGYNTPVYFPLRDERRLNSLPRFKSDILSSLMDLKRVIISSKD